MLSHNIIYTAVRHITDSKPTTIFKFFKEINTHYINLGFLFSTLHLDVKFAQLQALIHDMTDGPKVNLASSNEHVPEIERQIRMAKERIRYIQYSLTFDKIPKIFLIHLVFLSIKMMIHFPVKGGISDMITPTTIMTG